MERPPAFAEEAASFKARSEEEILSMLTDGGNAGAGVLGAFTNAGQLAGIIGLTKPALENGRAHGFMWGMYVAPEFSGHGIGSLLTEGIIAHARQAGSYEMLNLHVTVDNDTALQLYEKYGFCIVTRLPEKLQCDGQLYDEYLMRLDLQA